MKKFFCFVGALAAMLVACTSDDVLDVQNGNPIEFRAGKDFCQTRGAAFVDTIYNTVPSFYVSAFNAAGNVMFEKEQYVFDTLQTKFSCSKTHYFPADGSNLNFCAYYPNLEDFGYTVTGKQLVNFSPKADFKDQVDFLTATATANSTSGAAGVPLNFQHRLAMIDFNAKNMNEAYVVKISGIRLGHIASKGTFNIENNTWTLASSEETNYESVLADSAYVLNNVSQNIFKDRYAFLLPQSFASNSWSPATDPTNSAEGAYIAFKISVKTSGGVKVFPAESSADEFAWVATPIPSTWEWTAGYLYNYTIDFTDSIGYVSPEDGGDEGEEIKYGEGKIDFHVTVTSWNPQDLNLVW